MSNGVLKLGTVAFAGAVLAAGAFVGGAALAPGKAAAQELKMAFFPGPRHPIWPNMMEPWGKKVEAANVGLTVKPFIGGSIGGPPPGAFRRIVNGIADIELFLPGYTSNVFPKTLAVEIPLQYEDTLEATRAMWRVFDKHFASEFDRVKVLAMFAIDRPVVMTNKLVRVPDDLKGLRLRTPSANQGMVISGLGATPVDMPITQLYNAVEKGVVDGSIVGISVVNSYKIQEVVKNFVVDIRFGFSPLMIAMNRKSYDQLSKAQRDVIDANSGLDYSLIGARSYGAEREQGIKTVEERQGAQVVRITDAERKQWENRLAAIVEDWIQSFEKQGLPYRQIVNDYLNKSS